MFPDFDVILNSIVSLAVVLAPIEVIIATKAIGIWRMLGSFKVKAEDPDFQKTMMRNVGQGVGAGLLERLGAAKGGATRTMTAAMQEGIAEGANLDVLGGLMEMPALRKYKKDLSLVIGGYQMFQQLRAGGLMGPGNGQNLLPGSSSSGQPQ